MPFLYHLPVLATSQDAFRKPLSFQKPIIMDHKEGGAETHTVSSVYTGVLGQEPAGLLHVAPAEAHSGQVTPALLLGLWEALGVYSALGGPGTSLRSHRWKPEVGYGCEDCPDKARGIPHLAPESQPTLLFMFRPRPPLRILLSSSMGGKGLKNHSFISIQSAQSKMKMHPLLEKNTLVNKCALQLTTQPLLSVSSADCGRTFLGPAVLCCSLDNPLSIHKDPRPATRPHGAPKRCHPDAPRGGRVRQFLPIGALPEVFIPFVIRR